MFGCCALQRLVEICFFNVLCAKKLNKQKKQNLLQNDKILKKIISISEACAKFNRSLVKIHNMGQFLENVRQIR